MSALVANQSPLLHPSGGLRNSLAADSEHASEELVREVKLGSVSAVLGHQKPTRQACVHLVMAAARDHLRKLLHQHVYVGTEHATQGGTAAHFAAKARSAQAQGDPFALNKAAQGAVSMPRMREAPSIPSVPIKPTSRVGGSPSAVNEEMKPSVGKYT